MDRWMLSSPVLFSSSCQYRSPRQALTPPPHLLPPAFLHLLLLRSSGEPPLPLPPRQRRLAHQAVAQHERPIRRGGQTSEEQPAEEQTPQRKHHLLQRGHGERRGRGGNPKLSVPTAHLSGLLACRLMLSGRWRPPSGCCGSPCSRCHQSCCVCASVTCSPGSPSSPRPSSSQISWARSSTTEILLYGESDTFVFLAQLFHFL